MMRMSIFFGFLLIALFSPVIYWEYSRQVDKKNEIIKIQNEGLEMTKSVNKLNDDLRFITTEYNKNLTRKNDTILYLKKQLKDCNNER